MHISQFLRCYYSRVQNIHTSFFKVSKHYSFLFKVNNHSKQDQASSRPNIMFHLLALLSGNLFHLIWGRQLCYLGSLWLHAMSNYIKLKFPHRYLWLAVLILGLTEVQINANVANWGKSRDKNAGVQHRRVKAYRVYWRDWGSSMHFYLKKQDKSGLNQY